MKHSWLVPSVVIGALAPLAVLLERLGSHTLGADPIAIALNWLGILALALLLASLAATPARLLLGVAWPLRLRRPLGLLAFLYASLHALLYVVVDQGLALDVILEDVAERPFIAFGVAAFVLLVPLAATSTNAMRKRLGNARWTALHWLVYPASLLAVGHFVQRVKRDLTEPVLYGLVLLALLAVRLRQRARARAAARVGG